MPKPDTKDLAERLEGDKDVKRVFIIATEDSKSGACAYFNQMNASREFTKFAFTLDIIPSVGGHSSPEHIYANANDRKSKRQRDGWFDPEEGDLYWIVCDVDSWPVATLEKVIHDCSLSKIEYAFSNPCFELWVLYHQETYKPPPFPDSASCKTDAVKLLSSRKGGYEGLVTRHQIHHAIKNAKSAATGKKGSWPKTQGSDVYRLAEMLV